MATARDALNEARWRDDALDQLLVWYVHRGAPGDRRACRGSDILELGSWFFRVRGPRGGTSIPYHRVLCIEHAGRVRWQRRSPER